MLFIHTKEASCIVVRYAVKSLTSALRSSAESVLKINVIPKDNVGRYLFRSYMLKRNYMANFSPVNYVTESYLANSQEI